MISLCIGMSGIRFGWMGLWEYAVLSVVISLFLDNIDGRVARYLGSSNNFGIQLDSLADLVNFGVSPGIIMYFFFFASLEWFRLGFCSFFCFLYNNKIS